MMKIINTSGNTVYAEDIDVHFPYQQGEVEEIETDLLKRSRSVRQLILSGLWEIVEYNPYEQIEASLVRMVDLHKQQKNDTSEITDNETHDKADSSMDICITGLFYDAGGYAKVNRNLAINLTKLGFNVLVKPKRGSNQLDESELREIQQLERTKIGRNHIAIDSVVPSFAGIATSRYKILYTTVESYSVPDQFIECSNQYNEIWVVSEFCRRILEPLVKPPVYVVPDGVDIDLYTEAGERFDFQPRLKNFVFISVFGWSYRKGYDALLKAYIEGFTSSDDVSLLIVSRYQYSSSNYRRNKIKQDIDAIIAQSGSEDVPHIARYGSVIKEADMPRLYRSGNCFVLPSRGEGFSICPLEASMCGLPVIITNTSGHTDYASRDNCFLVNIDELAKVEPGQMSVHFWDGQLFPRLRSPQVISDIAGMMRYVFEHEKEAKQRNKKLQELVEKKYTWKISAEKAADRLNTIQKELNQ